MDKKTKIIKNRLEKWFNGNQAGPIKIQLNPTNNCNLNCISCSARGKRNYDPLEEVSMDRYIKLIKEASELGIIYCDICGGGEPFTRPKTTLSIMKEAKYQRMIGTVITNGTLFSEDTIQKIVKINWDYVNLSIDGPNQRINDSLRGKDTFDKNIKAIKLFNYWKKKLNKSNLHLSIYSVISRKNYRYINELVDLVVRLNVEGLYLQPIVVRKVEWQNLVMNENDIAYFKKILIVIKNKILENNIKSNIEFVEKTIIKDDKVESLIKKDTPQDRISIPTREIFCFSPWIMVVIRADGIVGPCPPGVEFIKQVNIKNQSLKKIWYGEVFNDFRNNILGMKQTRFCNSCGSMETIENKRILEEIEPIMSLQK